MSVENSTTGKSGFGRDEKKKKKQLSAVSYVGPLNSKNTYKRLFLS